MPEEPIEITLDTIVLPPDTLWTDQFAEKVIDQSVSYTLGGRMIVQQSPINSGRPVTLSCEWVTLETIRLLEELRDTLGAQFELTLTNHVIPVMFAFQAGVVLQATPVIDYPDEEAEDKYNLIIKLMEINV